MVSTVTTVFPILLGLCLGVSALPGFIDRLPQALSDLSKFPVPFPELPKFLPIPGSRSSVGLGKCPKPEKPDEDFDLTKFLGTWYEIRRTGLIFEFGQKCVQARYSVSQDRTVTVNHTGTSFMGTEHHTVATGTKTDQSNVLGVKFLPLSLEFSYWIVDTDFHSYALVVSCNDVLNIVNIKDAWILSRTPSMDVAIQEILLKKLETLGIPKYLLKETEQVTC